MTAYEAFERAIKNGEVPAAIIVENFDGKRGLATISLSTEGNSRAEEYVFSEDKRDRAIAAVYACHAAARSVERYHEELQVPAVHSRME